MKLRRNAYGCKTHRLKLLFLFVVVVSAFLLLSSETSLDGGCSEISTIVEERLKSGRRLPTDYTYILSPDWSNFIPTTHSKLAPTVIAVFVRPGAFERRAAIRRKWLPSLQTNPNLRLLHLIGRVAGDEENTHQTELEREHATYGDLLQVDFTDSYVNLTYKSHAIYTWTSRHFIKDDFYLVRIDDDAAVNTDRLLRFIESASPRVSQSLIYGSSQDRRNRVVNRDCKSKWYIPHEQYPAEVYPEYVVGLLTVTSAKAARRLAVGAANQSIFHIDDVYFNGILAQQLSITLQPLDSIDASGILPYLWYSACTAIAIHPLPNHFLNTLQWPFITWTVETNHGCFWIPLYLILYLIICLVALAVLRTICILLSRVFR